MVGSLSLLTIACSAGWGLFNLVEGIIDRYVLNLHHLVERLGLPIFDHAFLASGVIFIVAGMSAVRSTTETPRG